MKVPLYFIWYHPLGGNHSYEVDETTPLRESLIDFLHLLHSMRNSIIHFDKESIESANNENQELQEKYELRRQQLIANPRIGRFPPIVFIQHTKDKKVRDTEEYFPDMQKYREGKTKGDLIDFSALDEKILEELNKYKLVIDLAKDTRAGYSGNIGVFLLQLSSDTDSLDRKLVPIIQDESQRWQMAIGEETLGSNLGKHPFYILENCLSEKFQLLASYAPREFETNIVALSTLPERTKYVGIANDLTELTKGVGSMSEIESCIDGLTRIAWEKFLDKMDWERPY